MSDETLDPNRPMSRMERLDAPAEHQIMFPTDRREDRTVSRREFGKFFVVVSGGMVCGQGWIALRSAESGEADADAPPQPIAKVDDVPVGGAIAVPRIEPTGDPVLLVRLAADKFVAYVQRCTHLSCSVVWDAKAKRIHCPCHNGCFDAASGRPTAGPAKRPLTGIRIEVRDGVVFAAGARETA